MPVLALLGALLLGGCGGGGEATTATTAAEQPRGTVAELRWAAAVDGFVAGLLPDLKRLERLTGGGPRTGAVGRRIDRRVFVPGPTRRAFESTMTGLGACSITLAALVPRAPTVRLRPARATLAHACSRLEQVPSALQAPVLRATSPAGVEPGALRYAAASAGEGVRGIVDGLTTVRRLVGSRR